MDAAVQSNDGAPFEAAPPVAASRASIGAVIPLAIGLVLWLTAFTASGWLRPGPNGKGMAGDFAIFLAGAQVLETGHNPYDRILLYRTERTMLTRQGVAAPPSRAFIRVGNPPYFFWLLQPLTRFPFVPAAIAWVAAMYLLCAAGFLAILRFSGWRIWALPLAFFLAMPQTVLAAYYGNVDGIVFAAVGFSLILLARHPTLAGMLLTLTLLKPQVGLPAAMLLILFQAADRRAVISGFALGLLALFGLSSATGGPYVIDAWFQALTGYSKEIGVQPDIASLSGLYVYAVSSPVRSALQIGSLASAAVATVLWWWKCRNRGREPLRFGAWLWVLWFLATPFAHFHDEILLAVPVIALLGRNAAQLARRSTLICLYALLLGILLFPVSRLHTDLQSLTLLPLLGVSIWVAARSSQLSSEKQVVQ